jgi:hypothetical protein
MRLVLLTAILMLSACVGFVEYDPTEEQECAQTSATVIFPVQVTEDACE